MPWYRSLEINPVEFPSVPGILAFWHRDIFSVIAAIVMHGDPRRYVALVSKSLDGQRLAAVLKNFGFHIESGSSTTDGYGAILRLRDPLSAGMSLLITPDGPRGPERNMKGGVIDIARLAGVAVNPVHVQTERHWVAKSWDAARFPVPFSKLIVRLGEKLRINKSISDEERLVIQRKLASALDGC